MQLTAFCNGLFSRALMASQEAQELLTKTTRIMRLMAILLTVFCFQLSARTWSQTVTFSGKKVSIETLLKEVKKQTGFFAVYDAEDVKFAHPVSINAADVPLADFLNNAFKGQLIGYVIQGRTIFVSKLAPLAAALKPENSGFGFIPVTGVVRGPDQQPLSGVNVMVKGSKTGTITDGAGKFMLNADAGSTLVISCVGYETKEVSVAGTSIAVTLSRSVSELNETVIIGYGTTTKRMNTGSVASITSADIEKQPVSNILLAMQGRITGMQISTRSGLTASAPDIQIRGDNSLAAGASPLFILDGVPVPESQNPIVSNTMDFTKISLLFSINPAEIERVDVLKDADATSIYGSRGANGVVLITTKRGDKGKLKIGVNAYTGFQKMPHFINMLSATQYNSMRREAMFNDGIVPTAANAPDLFTWDSLHEHNWQREFLGKTSVTQDMNLSVSGGSSNTQFYVNAGYHKDGSIMLGNSEVSRKSFRANLSHLSTDRKFSLDLSSSYSMSDMNMIISSLVAYITLPTHYPIYNANGSPNWTGSRSFPLAGNLQPYSNPSKYYNGHVKVGYEPLNGLRLSVSAGYNNNNSNQKVEQPVASLNPASNNGGTLRLLTSSINTWIIEPQGEYQLNAGGHHFKLLSGGSFQKTASDNLTVTGTNFINDALISDIGSAATKTIAASNSQYSYASFFSRLTYDYKQKYLANISFRRDGSSRFGPGKRFGNFGSVGAGWIFSEETWIKSALPFLSFGKLRASYGVSGNDQIADYGYISTYSSIATGALSYNGATLKATRIANPDYRWEETRKFEAALELGFLHDRLLLTSSFFRNRSGNQLVSYALSPQTGFSGYQANFPAIVQNQGWEADLTSKNVHTKHFDWKTTVNFSRSKNILARYDNLKNSSYYSIYVVGESLGVFQTFHFEGLDANGVPVITDRNKSGTINFEDAVPSGDNDPLFGGMSNDFSYKNFNFSFFVQYTRFSSFSNLIPGAIVGTTGTNQTTYVLDRWQKPGDELVTDIPKFTTRSATYTARFLGQADHWQETMNIFRLSNIALSYTLPASIMKKIKMTQGQLYMNAQNLWVNDKNRDIRLDPATGNTALPPLRTFTFGINCTF